MAITKSKFRTKYNPMDIKFRSPTGEKTEIRHEPEIGKDGKRKLNPTREVPIYDLIQASRDECDIERIVKRAIEGDANALNAIQGQYMDVTNAPKSLAQAQQLIINAKNDFDKLPAEVKKEFEYNPEIYVAQVGSKHWFDAMGITALREAETKKAEAKKQFEIDQAQAMKNLAGGNAIINKGVEE